MQDIKCQLTGYRVIKTNFEVDVDKQGDALTLTIESKLQCSQLSNGEGFNGLLNIETKVYSTNDSKFKSTIMSQSLFSFDKEPEDFEKVMVEKCFPLAQARVAKTIKEITVAMGMTPLDMSNTF